jgi:hypothetical protein
LAPSIERVVTLVAVALRRMTSSSAAFLFPEEPALEVVDLADPANGRELGRYSPAARARLPVVPMRSGP